MKEKVRRYLTKLYRFSNSWVGTIVIVLLAIFFFAQAFVIPSGSMKNTLHEGDFLIVKKFSYGIPIPRIPFLEVAILPDFNGNGHLFSGEGPKRGDIVVFRYPKEPKVHYVKRCVGVGGDGVMVRDGALYIKPHEGTEYTTQNYPADRIFSFGNELWVKEPFKNEHRGVRYDEKARASGGLHILTKEFGPITVREGSYFMMGDNRDHSNDSRFWGSVPYEYIVGTPWFVYFSCEPRSYDEMIGNQMALNNNEELAAVCGEDTDLFGAECRTKWERHRYKVRWNRIGRGVEGLEELL
ncbi:MAG: signal peptidase I [Helicobacteraceae bacterium]|jgi:signal peptidase I|nr:signal peptidase I [Helicobacteraceae bacterium]